MSKSKQQPTLANDDELVAKLVEAIGHHFHTFGGGRRSTFGSPVAAALQDKPLMFATGVDVKQVVRYVLSVADVKRGVE